MTDTIFIRDLQVSMIIGILPHEREQPQTVILNIDITTDTAQAGGSDDLSASIDYAALADQIKDHCATHQPLTVEALAEDLAALCLAHPRAAAVRIQVEKPQAVPDTRSVGVSIQRVK